LTRHLAPALLGLLFSCQAWSADIIGGSHAKLIIRATQQISGLSWRAELVPVVIKVDKQGRKTPVAEIEGVFARPDANLLIRQTRVKLSPIGEFRLSVPLIGKTTQLQIVAMGANNSVESEVLELFTDWPGVQTRILQKEGPKKFVFSPGLNFSFISYDESSLAAPFTEKALTFKAGVSYRAYPSRLSLEAGGYYTLAAISKSSAETAKFLGLNLRLGYALPFVAEPWSLSLQAGLYYTTMFVTNNAFGFTNMAGPQFYPSLRREFGNGNSIQLYFKVSPVTTGTGKLFADREIAGGGAYVIKLGNGHSMPITFDISSLLLKLEAVEISSSTVSVGFGYGF
jgi:hypothetical protein